MIECLGTFSVALFSCNLTNGPVPRRSERIDGKIGNNNNNNNNNNKSHTCVLLPTEFHHRDDSAQQATASDVYTTTRVEFTVQKHFPLSQSTQSRLNQKTRPRSVRNYQIDSALHSLHLQLIARTEEAVR